MKQIEEARRKGRDVGLATPIEKYPTDEAARHKARLENLKKVAELARAKNAKAKEYLDQVREEMKAAGVYEKYKKIVTTIDGMCSGDHIDPDDVNAD